MAKFDSYPDNSAPADADLLISTDVSDTSADASGTTKKLTVSTLLNSGLDATVAALTATGRLTVSSATPRVDLTETDQAADAGKWKIIAFNGEMYFQPTTDGGTAQATPLRLGRDGSVVIPTPTAAGQALAWGDDATVAALDATTGDFTGNVTLETAFAALQLDATTQGYIRFQGGDGITRAELTYNAGTGLFQLSRRDAAGTFQNAAFVYDVGTDAFAFQSASVTVPTPTASGQAVKVVAWDDTTGRYAVQGPNGVLEQGDTEWRDVTSLLDSPWTADYVLLRRIGQTVEWAFGNLNANGAVSSTFMTAPTGYSSLRISTVTAANRASAVLYGNASTPGGGLETIVGTYCTNGDSMRAELATVSGYGNFTYTTTNTWPSSLPGTAA
jgi:hypothetical protein